MNSWDTLFTVNGQIKGQVHKQRGIILGDSLSSFLYDAALISLIVIFRQRNLENQGSKNIAMISHLI